MKKIWTFLKTKFLTKKFLSFGIIGVINTGIHMAVYWLCFNPLTFKTISLDLGILNTNLGAFLSNIVAFVVASVFSYFANVIFTFKPTKKSGKQFSYVMGVFVLRMFASSLLTAAFDFIILRWILQTPDYAQSWMSVIAPFFASALMIPIAYFALEYVFKKTGENTSDSIQNDGKISEKSSKITENNVK
jgi:putative flippase GtrA